MILLKVFNFITPTSSPFKEELQRLLDEKESLLRLKEKELEQLQEKLTTAELAAAEANAAREIAELEFAEKQQQPEPEPQADDKAAEELKARVEELSKEIEVRGGVSWIYTISGGE